MARSLLQTTNQTSTALSVNSVIPLGYTLRRFGCNLLLSKDSNSVEVCGGGYFTFDCNVTISPTEDGTVSVALYENGVQIPGAIASGYVTAGNPITLPINTTIRQQCCKMTSNITCVLLEGPGDLINISLRSEKK